MRELTLPFVPAVFLQGTQWHTAYVLSGGAICRGTRLAWNCMQCTYDCYRLAFVLVSPVAADTASLDHDCRFLSICGMFGLIILNVSANGLM